MGKQVNYPIKYAIMPVEEQVGWASGVHGLVKDIDVVAYIVCKCYVIAERRKYASDGTSKIESEIVFLYNRRTVYGSFEPAVPEFSLYGKCTNSILVDAVFDDFDAAKSEATRRNEQIKRKSFLTISFQKDVEKQMEEIKTKHGETIEKYTQIEASITADDIEITASHEVTLRELIDKILTNPTEFYTRLASSLPEKERGLIEDMIIKSCDNCTESETCQKRQEQQLESAVCPNWKNEELIGRQFIYQRRI